MMENSFFSSIDEQEQQNFFNYFDTEFRGFGLYEERCVVSIIQLLEDIVACLTFPRHCGMAKGARVGESEGEGRRKRSFALPTVTPRAPVHHSRIIHTTTEVIMVARYSFIAAP